MSQLSSQINKTLGIKYSEEFLAKLPTKHFTIFRNKIICGKNRVEIEYELDGIFGDRYDVDCDEEDEDCEDYYICEEEEN